MNTVLRPSLTLRKQRESLRNPPSAALRSRPQHAQAACHSSASDCVFKRFPTYGESTTVLSHV